MADRNEEHYEGMGIKDERDTNSNVYTWFNNCRGNMGGDMEI